MLKPLVPEQYDETRRAKYLAENYIANPDAAPINVVIVRDEAPEGVVAVEAEEEQEH